MKNLFSIRMRASKQVKSQKPKVKSKKTKINEEHISGAEGIFEYSEIQNVVKKYIKRALTHSRGKADRINITIEEIKQKPKEISTLPVTTVSSCNPEDAREIIAKLLISLGISKIAMNRAFKLINKGGMRGAAFITKDKGIRLEPDIERGIRVSRLGINKSASRKLSLRLAKFGINTETVKEALILASKVISTKKIIGELCVSDDPNYTTGYIASKKFGYVRIPNIKRKGIKRGGRAFFLEEGLTITNIEEIINYLERTPVMINRVSTCRGIILIDELLNYNYI